MATLYEKINGKAVPVGSTGVSPVIVYVKEGESGDSPFKFSRPLMINFELEEDNV